MTVCLCGVQVHHYIRPSEKNRWNLVSAAIFNGGGIRSSIDEHYNNGENHKVPRPSSGRPSHVTRVT